MTHRMVVLVVLAALAVGLPLAGWLAAPTLAPALHHLPVPGLFPVPTPTPPRSYGPFVVPAHPVDMRVPATPQAPSSCLRLYIGGVTQVTASRALAPYDDLSSERDPGRRGCGNDGKDTAMAHTTGGPHTLYPTILGDSAVSTCYSCGARKPSAHLIWMRHPAEAAFLALCAVCHAAPSADAAALLRARIMAYHAAWSGDV